jgi:hypothetical protein
MEEIVLTLKGHQNYNWEYGMRPLSSYFPLSLCRVPYMIGLPKNKTN